MGVWDDVPMGSVVWGRGEVGDRMQILIPLCFLCIISISKAPSLRVRNAMQRTPYLDKVAIETVQCHDLTVSGTLRCSYQ